MNGLQSSPSSKTTTVVPPTSFINFSTDKIYIPLDLYKDDTLEILDLPVRLENALKRGAGIKTVGQFYEFPEDKFRRIKNIGPKSIKYYLTVKKIISERLNSSSNQNIKRILPVPEEVKPTIPNIEVIFPKEELLDLLLTRCAEDRQKDIIRRRYGLDTGERQTLEEIGETYGVTRERVRQIQERVLRRMKHPSTRAKRPLIENIEKLIYDNGGLITDEEADIKTPDILNGIKCDGSSLLDLMSDLKWIQSFTIGKEIKVYSPFFSQVSLEEISEKINTVIKEEPLGIKVSQLASKVLNGVLLNDLRFNRNEFIFRYCSIDPRIEKFGIPSFNTEEGDSSTVFRHYTSGHFVTKGWVILIKKVLEEEQSPMHFTEIANKVNDLLRDSKRRIDVRRIHGVLIENKEFAHTGIRGTYGLIDWGIRKETTPELVEECLKKAGFPLHWKQIYNYVSKYKDSSPGNIVSVLEFNKRFEEIDNGIYQLRKAE